MADLSKLVPAETARILVKDPVTGDVLTCDSDGSEMYVDIYGAGSKQSRKLNADYERAKSKNKKNSSDDYDYDLNIKRCAGMICGWNIEYGGEKPALTNQKAIDVLNSLNWLTVDIMVAALELSNFLENQPSD